MKRLTKLFAGLVFLVVIVTYAYGQIFPAKVLFALQANGTVCDKTAPNDNFYSYPVLFDGNILDFADFKIKNQGQLTLVRKNPGTGTTTELPFYIYLSRNGKTVAACKTNLLSQPVSSVEIADILSLSKAGDVLMIIPLAKPDGKTKIILGQQGC